MCRGRSCLSPSRVWIPPGHGRSLLIVILHANSQQNPTCLWGICGEPGTTLFDIDDYQDWATSKSLATLSNSFVVDCLGQYGILNDGLFWCWCWRSGFWDREFVSGQLTVKCSRNEVTVGACNDPEFRADLFLMMMMMMCLEISWW